MSESKLMSIDEFVIITNILLHESWKVLNNNFWYNLKGVMFSWERGLKQKRSSVNLFYFLSILADKCKFSYLVLHILFELRLHRQNALTSANFGSFPFAPTPTPSLLGAIICNPQTHVTYFYIIINYVMTRSLKLGVHIVRGGGGNGKDKREGTKK